MLNSYKKKCAYLVAILSLVSIQSGYAQERVASVSANSLPINVANKSGDNSSSSNLNAKKPLVSPSKAKSAKTDKKGIVSKENMKQISKDTVLPNEGAKAHSNVVNSAANNKENLSESLSQNSDSDSDFDFDLKMQSIDKRLPTVEKKDKVSPKNEKTVDLSTADLPKDIQYTANPVEALGNSILSKMDGDLFSQMSEIEKSTTLLTLELRREKIRNEIEAQKAIRQKNKDEAERQKEEERLRSIEREKQVEAQVLKEKQILLDKEKMFEIIKQRKLLNAYMNQMLVNQQEWLREKQDLYAQLDKATAEKRELIALFKTKIDKVLEASAKNIEVAEAAKTNFERVVKNLKAKNEQLRKRVEVDAKIIKNAKNSLYLKSQSINELNDKNAQKLAQAHAETQKVLEKNAVSDEKEEEKVVEKLSTQYAILGITGRAGHMNVEVISASGDSLSLKVGSPLPTGHIVSEIGSDYAKFSRDGENDFLYIGKGIEGISPTLGLEVSEE